MRGGHQDSAWIVRVFDDYHDLTFGQLVRVLIINSEVLELLNYLLSLFFLFHFLFVNVFVLLIGLFLALLVASRLQ
jgi:hypothetical protein